LAGGPANVLGGPHAPVRRTGPSAKRRGGGKKRKEAGKLTRLRHNTRLKKMRVIRDGAVKKREASREERNVCRGLRGILGKN